jgi:methylmalonyl-CoA mutase N-terminal domain/subunit
VFGGTQSLHTNSMDEALALPSEKAVQIALRTQQVIAYESGARRGGPLAGSYYVESLNDCMEQALRSTQRIEERGGVVKAVEEGPSSASRRRGAPVSAGTERKQRIIICNEYVDPWEKQDILLLRIDAEMVRAQEASLSAARRSRNDAVCTAANAPPRRRGPART